MNKTNNNQKVSYSVNQEKAGSRKHKRKFTSLYIGGILLAMLLAYLIIYHKWLSVLLLIESLIHLTFLVVLSYINRPYVWTVYEGERIQTAGYLHTLIGFSVAIGLVGTGGIQIDDFQSLLTPMSSALWTSIIGWLFGGELSATEDITTNEIKINGRGLLKKIEPQAMGVESNVSYVKPQSIKGVNNSYKGDMQLLEVKFQQLMASIEKSNDFLVRGFQTNNSKFEKEAETLTQALQKLNLTLEENSRAFPKAFNNFNSTIQENTRSLAINFDDLKKESRKVSISMSDTAKAARQAANCLEDISRNRRRDTFS